jgi:iron complex transport system substrate-binding protein
MMVAGKNTQVEKMIELAGGVNAVDDFTEFKPLTAEALVAANPDVILLFDSGLSSLGGVDGLLEVQGIRQTNAGKNKKFVEMEGQFLTGFSQRLGKAVEELAKRIH